MKRLVASCAGKGPTRHSKGRHQPHHVWLVLPEHIPTSKDSWFASSAHPVSILVRTQVCVKTALQEHTWRQRETMPKLTASDVALVNIRQLLALYQKARARHARLASTLQQRVTAQNKIVWYAHLVHFLLQWVLLMWIHVNNVLRASMLQQRATMRRQTVSIVSLVLTLQLQAQARSGLACLVQKASTHPERAMMMRASALYVLLAHTQYRRLQNRMLHAYHVSLANIHQRVEILLLQTAFCVVQASTLSLKVASQSQTVYTVQ